MKISKEFLKRIRVSFLLGIVFITLLTILSFALFFPNVENYGISNFSVCDYSMGGGSQNLCYNQTFTYSLLLSIMFATIISTIIKSFFLKQLSMLTFVSGLVYALVILPLNIFIYLALKGFTNGQSGLFIGIILLLNLVILVLFSIRFGNQVKLSNQVKY